MKDERILMFFKFVSIVFLVLFILLNIASIVHYQNKFIFILLFILFILFFIPSSIFYKSYIRSYILKDYKEVEEKLLDGKTYRFSRINSVIIDDYQRAIIDLKEKNSYILGRYDVLNNIKNQYKKDMKKARKLQQSMLPKKMPNNHLISSAYLYKPFEVIGGDFFDYVYINQNKILFIISDISRHGVEADNVTAMLKSVFRNLANSFESAGSMINEINSTLINTLPINYYLTMIVAEIDLFNYKVTYSNASHTPLLVSRGEDITEYSKGGTIVGLFPKAYYEEEVIDIDKGDILFFYTDGLTEASRSKNKYDFYSINRLKKAIYNNRYSRADSCIELIKKDFYEYLSYMSPDDDFTMVLFKIN